MQVLAALGLNVSRVVVADDGAVFVYRFAGANTEYLSIDAGEVVISDAAGIRAVTPAEALAWAAQP